jgi:hypothetical protein
MPAIGPDEMRHMPNGKYVYPEKSGFRGVEPRKFTSRRGSEKFKVIVSNDTRRWQDKLVHAIEVVVEKIMDVPCVETFDVELSKQVKHTGPARLVDIVIKCGLVLGREIERVM